MNYVDDEYIIDELLRLHADGHSIEVNWLDGQFQPSAYASPRITKSVGFWRASLEQHLASHNVDLTSLRELRFVWPAQQRKFMSALDDRGKSYKMYVNESK